MCWLVSDFLLNATVYFGYLAHVVCLWFQFHCGGDNSLLPCLLNVNINMMLFTLTLTLTHTLSPPPSLPILWVQVLESNRTQIETKGVQLAANKEQLQTISLQLEGRDEQIQSLHRTIAEMEQQIASSLKSLLVSSAQASNGPASPITTTSPQTSKVCGHCVHCTSVHCLFNTSMDLFIVATHSVSLSPPSRVVHRPFSTRPSLPSLGREMLI